MRSRDMEMCADLTEDTMDESEETDDAITALVDLQSTNGCFQWGKGFDRQGLDKKKVTDSTPSGTEFSEWLTALAIQLMELKLQDHRDVLELVIKKARKYLTFALEPQDDGELLTQARAFIQTM